MNLFVLNSKLCPRCIFVVLSRSAFAISSTLMQVQFDHGKVQFVRINTSTKTHLMATRGAKVPHEWFQSGMVGLGRLEAIINSTYCESIHGSRGREPSKHVHWAHQSR